MNAAAKLFIALVIVAAGYCLASLFGPAQLPPSVSLWNSVNGRGGSAAGPSENPALGFGNVRLTPDTTPSEDASPSAVLKGTVAPSPSANLDASAGEPLATSEPAPLWLSAHADHIHQSRDGASRDEHLAAFRNDWPADEVRKVSPAFFAEGNLTADPSQDERMKQLGGRMVASYAELDDAESIVRTHVVIDGDSLSRLAERYLDDPGRWQEIFAMNRDQLTDPGLLPIGVELKLPPKSEHASDRSAGGSDAAAPGMVKVDPAESPTTQPPEARLLRPQSAKPIYQQYQFTSAD